MTQVTVIIWVCAYTDNSYICVAEASAPETRRSESVSRHGVYGLSTPHYCSVIIKYTTLHYCSVMSETKSQTLDVEITYRYNNQEHTTYEALSDWATAIEQV